MSSPVIEDDRRWDLSEIYPDAEAWTEDRTRLRKLVERLQGFRGTLDGGASTVRDALDLAFKIERIAETLHTYASLLSDEDVRLAGPQRMKQEIEAYFSDRSGRSGTRIYSE